MGRHSHVNTPRLDGITRPVRSHVHAFVAGTSGATRVWLFTLLLAALTVCLALLLVPAEPPIAVALHDPGLV